jgi:hypothetical protein
MPARFKWVTAIDRARSPKTGRSNRDRINVHEDYVSEEKLKVAVAKVGPMASGVAKHLGK